ncbi:hypothetical protein XENTR_v10022056 [Xenopus tropicalis]|nr:hypothetical protein XENTR_v10022056 [Xenopus tropicalis]
MPQGVWVSICSFFSQVWAGITISPTAGLLYGIAAKPELEWDRCITSLLSSQATFSLIAEPEQNNIKINIYCIYIYIPVET